MLPGERVEFRASDGRSLVGHLWLGEQAAERSVMCLNGMGAPQRYWGSLAAAFARMGWGVLTFDYRGVGESHRPEDFRSITADDWAARDIVAAADFARRATATRQLCVCAHSVGGQLFGMSPAASAVDGALLLAAQHGQPRFFRGRARLRVEYVYRAFPLIARVLGTVPTGRCTFPERCPPGALVQWIGWGRQAKFRDAAGRDLHAEFARYRRRLIAARFADDHALAPADSVEALTRLYTAADVRHVALSPEEFGVSALGHFGAFSPRAPKNVRERLHQLLLQALGTAA